MTALVSQVASPFTEVSHLSLLPPFKLDEELAKIEAEFCDSKAAAPSNKQLDPSTEQATTTMASSSSNGSNGSEARGGGGGGTPIYKLYRYVPPQRVWFLRCSVLK